MWVFFVLVPLIIHVGFNLLYPLFLRLAFRPQSLYLGEKYFQQRGALPTPLRNIGDPSLVMSQPPVTLSAPLTDHLFNMVVPAFTSKQFAALIGGEGLGRGGGGVLLRGGVLGVVLGPLGPPTPTPVAAPPCTRPQDQTQYTRPNLYIARPTI